MQLRKDLKDIYNDTLRIGGVKVIHPSNFDFDKFSEVELQIQKGGRVKSKHKKLYKNLVCAFDIETTGIFSKNMSVMYIWMFKIMDCVVIGRYWYEYITFVELLSQSMNNNEYLVVYVHNLSYEFQFLSGVFHFNKEEVFCVDNRKILKATWNKHIEYRCSYIHANASLNVWTHDMKVEHSKLSGIEFDYSKIRMPWTELTLKELQYCINDVWGLCECIEKEMIAEGDDLYTIPLTSTGYIRRDVKNIMKNIPHSFIPNIMPCWEVYQLLREAFRGGDVHANRYFVGIKLEKCYSDDRSSSYPDVMLHHEFPMSKFQLFSENSTQYLKKLKKEHRAYIMRVKMSGITLSDPFWGFPYLTKDKSRNIVNAVYDNGRILSADYLETTITDVDYEILNKEYNFEIEIIQGYHSRYGKLPKVFREYINRLYELKTKLKGVPGEENEMLYMRSKNKINAAYGMTAQDPVKQAILYIEEYVKQGLDIPYKKEEKDPRELLDAYNKKAFLPYQWGVWVTAWARWELHQGLYIDPDACVYTDTDSIKSIRELDFNEYNKVRIKNSKESGSYAVDAKGKTHYMGVFEKEDDYSEFATLGAKKYAYRDTNRKLHITIAGVNKKLGAEELEENGGIDRFVSLDGFVFVKGGGTESVYNDDVKYHWECINGGNVEVVKNVYIKPSTYTLGVTEEFEELLKDIRNFDFSID